MKCVTTCARRCARLWRTTRPSTTVATARTEPVRAEFIDAINANGWLAAMIPKDYGGSGLNLVEASIAMEEINRAGRQHRASPSPDVRHWHAAAPRLGRAEGPLPAPHRLGRAAPAVEGRHRAHHRHRHDAAPTTAIRKGDRYVVNGQKVWISRIRHSDPIILLARTTPLSEVKRRSEGLSIFLVDLHAAMAGGMEVKPIRNMVGHVTSGLFFDDLEIPEAA